jgi:hypothetical protein
MSMFEITINCHTNGKIDRLNSSELIVAEPEGRGVIGPRLGRQARHHLARPIPRSGGFVRPDRSRTRGPRFTLKSGRNSAVESRRAGAPKFARILKLARICERPGALTCTITHCYGSR